jgi:hypothetical protein
VNHLWYNFNKERKLQMANSSIFTNKFSGTYTLTCASTGRADLKVFGDFSGASVRVYEKPDNTNRIELKNVYGQPVDIVKPSSTPLYVQAGDVIELEIFDPQPTVTVGSVVDPATNLSAIVVYQ